MSIKTQNYNIMLCRAAPQSLRKIRKFVVTDPEKKLFPLNCVRNCNGRPFK